jgi:hypothetical protein
MNSSALVNETNGLSEIGHDYHSTVQHKRTMSLAQVAKEGGKITRVRILAERGMADISYVHATLPDGTVVPVCGTPMLGRSWKRSLIEWAVDEGVYAKALGLLDEGNWSVLR